MSDDLISRKAVIESVDRHTRDDGTLDDDISVILEEVETAFDKEKVIEDLTDWKNDADKWEAKYDEVGDIDNMDLQDMAVRCYVNAIEIVEKGGIG